MTDPSVKAYRVSWNGIDAIYFTETRGKAHAFAFRTINEVWGRRHWKEINVRREKKLDGATLSVYSDSRKTPESGVGYSENDLVYERGEG